MIRGILVLSFLSVLLSIHVYPQGHSGHGSGTVDFKNSCKPDVQELLQKSVAMLHSFRYGETEKGFREVLAADPSCAIAGWGIASILMANPLSGAGPSAEWSTRGKAALDEARRIGASTKRERDYIEAVGAYYEDWANRPERSRQLNRARAYETLAATYPDDDEAQIFHALYLSATQSLADQSYKSYLAAAEILEKQFAKHPNHPGAAHYLIHSYDAPPIAAKGLDAALRYAAIAPDAPHALHMPSHIFTRVGKWEDSIATNARSATSAKRDNDPDEQLHAMDYMVYAFLQLARDDDARRVAGDGVAAKSLRFNGSYAQAAIPARLIMERGDWKAAMSLVPTKSGVPYATALTHFARAIGAARAANAAAAENEIQELIRLRDELKTAKNEYWASEVEVSRLGAAAWTAFARGKKDEALILMRSAADAEDKNEKHIVTPGRLLPARELLGELLLELGRPVEALAEFEASQKREPGRFRGYFGAATAAEMAGNKSKAKLYYAKLVELPAGTNPRSELIRARRYIADGRSSPE